MTRRRSIVVLAIVIAALAGFMVNLPAEAGLTVDLTGVYSCNDGGTYYIRTEGSDIFWFGQGDGWTNVFHGTYKGQNLYEGKWADVPMGTNRGAGSLRIRRAPNPKTLLRESASGGFAGTEWTKVERPTIKPQREQQGPSYQGPNPATGYSLEPTKKPTPQFIGPDLGVGEFLFVPGSPQGLRVRVANYGQGDAKDSVLRLTVRRIQGTPVSRSMDVRVPAIGANSHEWLAIDASSILPDGVALDGGTAFKLNVDVTEIVVETDESNNEVWHNR